MYTQRACTQGLTFDQLTELRRINHLRTCKTCSTTKSITGFTYKISKTRDLYYVEYTCNKCKYTMHRLKHAKRFAQYSINQTYRELNTIVGRAGLLRNRARQRAKVYNHEFNLPLNFVVDKLNKGVCEATGIAFDFSVMKFNPYSPSLDRIDSDKGYTEDNVQITCLIYNLCKNKFTTEQVDDFFTKLKLSA